ncbi:DUF2267 domain-containing protein [Romeria aff. gracilis LEGE 07310]|uniref:DUF2267 domain-containing protein n=1 Tax=Vasconcelosia minhoensis LEGE 07310 TaxID=915328 RepID=A0A8J7AC66_9CYAN|nr:DUF2267 domain-containing protein [Romeria gracilis]MBE9076964.1 DUF2267 domain-containing protein [Romeria aff. gracilis LEGE 07310]
MVKLFNSRSLASRQTAEKSIRATFEVLANRMYGDEAKDLAAQIPEELGQYLRGHEGENGTYMSLDEFYSAIADKAGIEVTEARDQVRAIFAVIEEAVTPGQFNHLRTNLSDEYAELFPARGAASGR